MRPLRDPAPSRLSYRMNRLMLTPRFRTFLRFGVPLLAIGFTATIWASDETRRDRVAEKFNDIRRQVEERPEFLVHMMVIEGATPEVEADIRRNVPVDLPVSSFDLDLDVVREVVEGHDPVASATVQIRSGGVLNVTIEERVPVAVFRTLDGLELIDADGHRVIAIAARTDRPDLPLILGEGADARIAEALHILEAAEPVAHRVRGLRRIGTRRWDILLDRDQIVMLPETSPALVAERIMALDRAQDLLARDITVVDFRNPERPVLRLSETAVDALTRKPAKAYGANTQ